MTTLPPNHQFGRRTDRESRTAQRGVIERIWNHEVCTIGEGMIVASIASAVLIVGCVAKNATPVETVFSDPVKVTLPTKELDDTIAAVRQADNASRETAKAINAIDASNVLLTKPDALRWSEKTSEAIQAALTHSTKAKSINEVAADRIIEATLQTTDARARLKESEAQRERDRVEAKKKLDNANAQIEQLRAIRGQWLGYSIAGLGVLCLALGAIGIIGQKFIKLSFGAGAVGVGLIGIGLAVVNYAMWVSIIGVAMFIGLIVGGTIYFVRHAKRDDEKKVALFNAGKAIAKSIETAVDAVDDFNITDKARKVIKGVQSATPLAETIVDEAQIEMGKKTRAGK